MQKSSLWGKIIIIFILFITIPLIVGAGWLLLGALDINYLQKTEHEEIVYVVKLSAIFEEINSNVVTKSCSYVLRFSSGKEKEVNFNECDILNEGEQIRIKYLETMITKHILPIAFEKVH
jgi:hypothetical protein